MNLHKTFATPHGGGGPGAGPVAVSERLVPFLPGPRPVRDGDTYRWDAGDERSIGRMHSFWGNFGIIVRAAAHIRALGAEGLREAATEAIEPRQVMVLVEWECKEAFDGYVADPDLTDLHPHREKGATNYIWHLFDKLEDLRPILR